MNKTAYVPAGPGSRENAELAHMSGADRQALEQAGRDWTAAQKAGDESAKSEAHRRAEEIRGRYGYSGGGDGSEYISTRKGPDFAGMLNQWLEDAKKHQEESADYAVEQGAAQLEQARQEGERQLQARQDQVEREERTALDNQALYMEARGDRGGIGQAQYGSIQAQAMRDRQEVSRARMELATDTARKIADLRAQGQFRKADSLLKLTQDYLGRLTELYRWQEEHRLDEEKFRAQLAQWNREFEVKVGEMMGSYQDRPTLQARKEEQEAQRSRQDMLVRLGMAALEQGIRPSPSQQQALGWSDSQVNLALQHYKEKLRPAKTSGSRGSGSKGSGSKGSGGKPEEEDDYALIDRKMPQNLKDLDVYQKLYAVGCRNKSDAFYYLVHTVGVSDQTARSLAGYFDGKVENGDLQTWWEAYEPIPDRPIANVNGGLGVDRWIYVPGAGRISTRELPSLLQKGYLVERVDPKTGRVTYLPKRGKE